VETTSAARTSDVLSAALTLIVRSIKSVVDTTAAGSAAKTPTVPTVASVLADRV
jgi:hypothetical protein